jgi:uncharacterized protein (TIGR02996 family)
MQDRQVTGAGHPVNTLDALLSGIVAEPLEETRWLVLADRLEEFDDPRRAELLRMHHRLFATSCEQRVPRTYRPRVLDFT